MVSHYFIFGLFALLSSSSAFAYDATMYGTPAPIKVFNFYDFNDAKTGNDRYTSKGLLPQSQGQMVEFSIKYFEYLAICPAEQNVNFTLKPVGSYAMSGKQLQVVGKVRKDFESVTKTDQGTAKTCHQILTINVPAADVLKLFAIDSYFTYNFCAVGKESGTLADQVKLNVIEDSKMSASNTGTHGDVKFSVQGECKQQMAPVQPVAGIGGLATMAASTKAATCTKDLNSVNFERKLVNEGDKTLTEDDAKILAAQKIVDDLKKDREVHKTVLDKRRINFEAAVTKQKSDKCL